MSTIRSQPYSRQGRSNWDDIFGKKPEPKPSNVRIAGVCQCAIHEHCAKCDPLAFPLDDGFGNTWSRQCAMCHEFTMEIVRPGKVQCTNCG